MHVIGTFAVLAVCVTPVALSASRSASAPDLDWFFQAAGRDDRVARKALEQIAANWKHGYASMFVDLARLMRPARRPDSSVDVAADDIERGDATPPSDPLRGAQSPTHPSSVI